MRQSDALAAALAKQLKKEAEADELFGLEPKPEGTVIAWEMKYDIQTGPRWFSYVAIRAAGVWWITGSRGRTSLSWDELTEWLLANPTRRAQVLRIGKKAEAK